MVAHIPGEPAEMDEIMKLADTEGLPVVEDFFPIAGTKVRSQWFEPKRAIPIWTLLPNIFFNITLQISNLGLF